MTGRRFRSLAPAALGLAVALCWPAGKVDASAAARSSRAPTQIGGTWQASWRNGSGEPRRGLIVVEQRGAQLSARVESQGNATATGSIAGSVFTLHGSRLGVPFTITGRVDGRRMTGTLTSLLIERRFTATRRRGR